MQYPDEFKELGNRVFFYIDDKSTKRTQHVILSKTQKTGEICFIPFVCQGIQLLRN